MRTRRVLVAILVLTGLPPASHGLVLGQQTSRPTFRSSSTMVRVDVIVRDRDGGVVGHLNADDFQLLEDGKAQTIASFVYEEASEAPSEATTFSLLSLDRLREAARGSPTTGPPQTSSPAGVPSLTTLSGRRVIALLFDTSSMQPAEVSRAISAATTYVRERLSPADLVAVATVGQSLRILSDFTADREVLAKALAGIEVTTGLGFEQPVAEDGSDLPLDSAEFAIFNNDRRLRALKILATALAPLDRKKAILYFSSGLTRSGTDNQVELRATINAATRANVAIYPVDSRGLIAVVPGGEAADQKRDEAGRGTEAAFSGAGMLGQLSALSASQETLTTLAVDTGGQVFTDSNDLGPAFTRVQNDLSGYYLLGYSSANAAADGRFRRITVRLRNGVAGYRVEARNGYYAATDFAHLKRGDRERQLQEQVTTALSATDVPVAASTAWFRLGDNRYYVPISVAIPGAALRAPAVSGTRDSNAVSVDLLGVFLDEQGRSVGRLRDTVSIPVAQLTTLAERPLQYQSGVTLPAGRFRVKVVVRENTDGAIGSFEFPIEIPDVKAAAFAVSPVVFGTQLRALNGGPRARDASGPAHTASLDSERRTGSLWGSTSPNPLIRDGQELVHSLNHVVPRGQSMYFYYEAYNPAEAAPGATASSAASKGPSPVHVSSSVACYRGTTRVLESSVVDRLAFDDRERRATIFRLQLPSTELTPGLYACQVNVIDAVAQQFAFPRIAIYVK